MLHPISLACLFPSPLPNFASFSLLSCILESVFNLFSSSLNFSISVQFSSVHLLSHVRIFATPMNCSMPGLPVHHQLPEFTQTHVHRVGDAIQPSHPLSSPFPPAPNPSQHQSFPMSQLFA